jgi:dihydrofolate reductase
LYSVEPKIGGRRLHGSLAQCGRKISPRPFLCFCQENHGNRKGRFSKKLKKSKWDEAILSRDLTGKIRALKRGPGKNIIAFGGVSFASALLEKGLVDEFQFFVNPTALGKGLSIFKPLHKPLGLDLIGSNSYGCGIVVNKYVSARKTV